MFNVKLSQKIMEKFEFYVLCKNIFDDYNGDPFNPGQEECSISAATEFLTGNIWVVYAARLIFSS